jgi:hypothetical protein
MLVQLDESALEIGEVADPLLFGLGKAAADRLELGFGAFHRAVGHGQLLGREVAFHFQAPHVHQHGARLPRQPFGLALQRFDPGLDPVRHVFRLLTLVRAGLGGDGHRQGEDQRGHARPEGGRPKAIRRAAVHRFPSEFRARST